MTDFSIAQRWAVLTPAQRTAYEAFAELARQLWFLAWQYEPVTELDKTFTECLLALHDVKKTQEGEKNGSTTAS